MGRERREQLSLCAVKPRVEPRESDSAGRAQRDDVPAPILRVSHAGDEPVSLELTKDRVQVAAVDRWATSERGLTRRSLLGERSEHGEVLAAHPVVLEGLRDQGLPALVGLADQPAREPPQTRRWVVVAGRGHERTISVGGPNVGNPPIRAIIGSTNVELPNERSLMSPNPTLSPQLIGQAEKTLNAILERHLSGAGLSEPQWITLTLAVMGGDPIGRDQLARRVASAAKFSEADVAVTDGG